MKFKSLLILSIFSTVITQTGNTRFIDFDDHTKHTSLDQPTCNDVIQQILRELCNHNEKNVTEIIKQIQAAQSEEELAKIPGIHLIRHNVTGLDIEKLEEKLTQLSKEVTTACTDKKPMSQDEFLRIKNLLTIIDAAFNSTRTTHIERISHAITETRDRLQK